jgi:phosphoserine phosphatase RsbX
VCGDAFVVLTDESRATIALADGMGHGEEADRASTLFCEVVRNSTGWPLPDIMLLAAKELARTRGAAAGVLRVDCVLNQLEFCAVGNVSLRAATQTKFSPVWPAGFLGPGGRRAKPRLFELSLSPGDFLVLHSDGIRYFDLGSYRLCSAQDSAQHIVARHSVDHDDASCVCLKY